MQKDNRQLLRNDRWHEWASDGHVTDARKGLTRVPPEKPFPSDGPFLELPDPANQQLGEMPLREVIEKRRSKRHYSQEPISLDELSFLLWACQGVRRVKDLPSGSLTFRTVPSGGALHPFETYLCINHVEGVPPGLYRYLPIEHRLLFLREEANLMDEVLAANCGNRFVKDSAVFFIWTAIPARTEFQYNIVAAKIIALDAGHLCQNLYLAGEALDLGVCAIDGYYQAEMDAVVGVDGEDEFAVYAASVGRLKPR